MLSRVTYTVKKKDAEDLFRKKWVTHILESTDILLYFDTLRNLLVSISSYCSSL